MAAHGGHVSAHNRAGGGTCFELQLPLPPSPNARRHEDNGRRARMMKNPRPPPRSCCWSRTTPASAASCAPHWNPRAARCHEAAALERGRIELASRRPDLLVLDLGLPDGDGMTLLAELRGWSGMPVLVLSARNDEADKVAALDAGADDYLAKPFGVGELLARVRALLRRGCGRHRPRRASALATWSSTSSSAG